MKTQEIEPGSDLDQAADKLLDAWHEYRQFVKRHYFERLAGVVIVRRGNEIILHSESARYANQVLALTFDPTSDSFNLDDVIDEESRSVPD